jgi:pyruvate kinase
VSISVQSGGAILTTVPAPAEFGLDSPNAVDLLIEIRELRGRVLAEGEAILDSWGPHAREDSHAALDNLAHYLAMRHADLSGVQRRLQTLGLSSLGRSEAKVITALDAIIATLERLVGVPASAYPGAAKMQEADRMIRAARDRLFGVGPNDPYTRIMVTLPTEAASDPQLVCDLMDAGMSCARINCAHDAPSIWREMIVNIRAAERRLHRSCRILMDIAGPKCRIVNVPEASGGG